LSVAGPAERIDEQRDAVAEAVVLLAHTASRRLGHSGRN